MVIHLRKHLTENIYYTTKFKYCKECIERFFEADKVDIQEEGIAFYFKKNGTMFQELWSYNYIDNCKTLNKIIKERANEKSAN